jgi:ElaB/YqjD/DUF883 family membrane-anchored ribosome-binding protein
MSNPTKSNPEASDLQEQLKVIRADVAHLTDLLKGMAGNRTADAGKALQDQADELIRRGRESAEGATQRVKGAVSTIEEQIAENPVQSAFIALLIGIVIGSLGRR